MIFWAYLIPSFANSDTHSLYKLLSSGQYSVKQDFLTTTVIKNDKLLNKKFKDLPKINTDYDPRTYVINDLINPRYDEVIMDIIYGQGYMVLAIGAIALLPESVSNWGEEQKSTDEVFKKYYRNITTGPVIDEDDWEINWIGHPVFGAYYYTLARNDNLTIEESFVVSVLLSSFLWEYGYEAFAETPSWQDLWITPIVGSILGEGMYQIQLMIERNNGEILGSSVLGSLGYFLIDPFGNINTGLEQMMKKYNGSASLQLTMSTYPDREATQRFNFFNPNHEARLQETIYGFILEIH